MTRLLFWLAIAWLVVAGVRKLAGGSGIRAARRGPAPAEDMVRCARCQLNLPRSEAVACAAGWACCAAHAQAQPPAAQP